MRRLEEAQNDNGLNLQITKTQNCRESFKRVFFNTFWGKELIREKQTYLSLGSGTAVKLVLLLGRLEFTMTHL